MKRAIYFLEAPRPDIPDPADFFPALRAELDSIECRQRWRRVLTIIKACASHLVIAGDEDDA